MSKNELDFRIVIPARYASTRFPGKALAMLDGRPMLQHVYERACASAAAAVIIATDDERIAAAAEGFGATVAMTSGEHESGTDRIAEVAEKLGWNPGDIVVNVQGDAPFIPSADIGQVAELLDRHATASLATLCTAIDNVEEYEDEHVVKVVFDRSGRALYFSRSSIPASAHGHDQLPSAWRHVGIYAYRVEALRILTQTPPCEIERAEKLEQLRAMWLGMEIRVAVAAEALGPDVDTPADLEMAERFIADGTG
ncbi:MAG: 3-deoxy-manno-octulosonate cytidylyltransferase [Gammaproteobacteria bacterium]